MRDAGARSRSTTRASPPRRSWGRACSRSTAPSTRGTARRSSRPFRLGEVRAAARRRACEREAERLVDALAPRGEGELRRGFAGPLAARAVTHALGLDGAATGAVLGWYDAIVAAVTDLSAGPAARGREAARRGGGARRGGARPRS